MHHNSKISDLINQAALEMLQYIKEVESGYIDKWVPAAELKTELGLKVYCNPVSSSKGDKKDGWLFGILARILEDQGMVEFKKTGSRSFYRTKS